MSRNFVAVKDVFCTRLVLFESFPSSTFSSFGVFVSMGCLFLVGNNNPHGHLALLFVSRSFRFRTFGALFLAGAPILHSGFFLISSTTSFICRLSYSLPLGSLRVGRVFFVFRSFILSLFENRNKRFKASGDHIPPAWEIKSDFDPLRAQCQHAKRSTRRVKLDGSPGQEIVFPLDRLKLRLSWKAH